MELESADDIIIQAFNYMLIQKNKVAQTYNKRIKRKSFGVGVTACAAVPDPTQGLGPHFFFFESF